MALGQTSMHAPEALPEEPAAAQLALKAPAGWHGALQGLKLLAIYRVLTPLCQAVTILVSHQRFEVEVWSAPVMFMLALETTVALLTVLWLKVNRALSPTDLQVQALLDIALFTVMLYLTGGHSNPFAPLLVLPVMIVGMSLSAARLWMTALATVVCYLVVSEYHVPLAHPLGHDELDRLHRDGEMVNYVLTLGMLVFFSTRLFDSLRQHSAQAQEAQEARLRSEAVASIGALAATSAHELGSPLGTMAVVAAEMRRRLPDDAELGHDLDIIEAQIAACNGILADMASAGDDRRAQSASAATVEEFVVSALQRMRSTHPEATITSELTGPRPSPRVVIEASLRHALSNLLRNALRVSPHHVQVHACWNEHSLEVTVSDKGPGFSPQALKVLGRRVVGHGPREAGMGMGLLLGAETLQRMGGALHLSNGPDGGARVRMHVPLASILIQPMGAAHA